MTDDDYDDDDDDDDRERERVEGGGLSAMSAVQVCASLISHRLCF